METKINNLARIISEISKREDNLFYDTPKEIERALNDGRMVVFETEGRVVAFGGWVFHGEWAEICHLYTAAEFRNRGYCSKVFDTICKKLKVRTGKVCLFTQAKNVNKIAKKYGFKNSSYASLPVSFLLEIVIHRANLCRWFSYAKKYLLDFSKISKVKILVNSF